MRKIVLSWPGPSKSLHKRVPRPIICQNLTGDFTGLAVQNTNGGAFAYSGMLFYDHTGALTQFQGYNNNTHEYRINNIARNGVGQFNGSINFMLGGASKFMVAPNGNIGIGTTSPSALLEVSNVVPGGPANMWMTSYTNAVNPYYMARRARGTAAAPAARTCDKICTSCLHVRQFPPSIRVLMIISTLRVGPSGPLFLFWPMA